FNPVVAGAYDFFAWPHIAMVWPAIEKELQGVTGNVLEVGCGTGLVTSRLARLPFQVTAVEPSQAMLIKAQQRLKGQDVRLVVDRAQSLPVSSKFDALVMTYVLRHLKPEALPEVASEMARVTKPGARVVLADLHLPLTGAFPAGVGSGNPNYLILGVMAAYDPASLARFLENYGFQAKSVRFYPLSFVMRLDKSWQST
ncbi:MAG: methyltransferase domain-containing protein, partial [Dehalococcoidales bacterium]|nr:methyltransferase domain-containing protein [Dehalococcoidales bacterium]